MPDVIASANYECTGPGADAKDRVAWSHQLTTKEAKTYTTANILSGKDGWNVEDVLQHLNDSK